MKRIKKNIAIFASILFILIVIPAVNLYADPIILTYDGEEHLYNKPAITLEIDGKHIDTTLPPLQIDGRTLVPTREVFEHMGASVEWKSLEKRAYINHGNKLIVLEVNNKSGWVDGKSEELDVPPKIINGKLMLPIRFIGENLGYYVDWNETSHHIKINQSSSGTESDRPAKPSYKTEVERVGVRNLDSGESIYTIYLKEPLNSYSYFTQTGKIVVDIDDAKNLLAANFRLDSNPYVERVRTSQFKPDVTRVVFDLNSQVESKVEVSSNKKEIIVNVKGKGNINNEPELSGEGKLRYTSSPRETLILGKASGITTTNVKIDNDYRNLKTTITLPGNYSHIYKDQVLNISSSTIDRIVIKTNINTQITIYEKKIRAYELVDDGKDIRILFMQPREKYDKIVVLDFGHGGSDSGASANGLVEKNLNFEQGMHVYRHLENNPNIKVYLTRDNDTYPSNPSRAKLANDVGADIFISMHNNAFSGSQANGTEVLYSTKDPRSKQVAEIIQRNMVNNLGTSNRGTKPRPGLIVLNQTQMPAVLIETGFMTNPGDAEKLKSPEFNKLVGKVVYDSIVEAFGKISFR